MTKHTLKDNGDWLEKEAARFVSSNIPAYELIWSNFIGNKGNAQMAEMNNISQEDSKTRRDFSQYHYTILESLYFMQLIVDDENQIKQITSFDDYRKVINQIMAYQAYSGRLRDNLEKCFMLLAPSTVVTEQIGKLQEFYHERVVFIHGRKVPFAIEDNLFKIASIQKDTTSRIGFGLEAPWEDASENQMEFLSDELSKSINELKPLVNALLGNLYKYVKDFIEKRKIDLKNPTINKNEANAVSSTFGSSGSAGSAGIDYNKISEILPSAMTTLYPTNEVEKKNKNEY